MLSKASTQGLAGFASADTMPQSNTTTDKRGWPMAKNSTDGFVTAQSTADGDAETTMVLDHTPVQVTADDSSATVKEGTISEGHDSKIDEASPTDKESNPSESPDELEKDEEEPNATVATEMESNTVTTEIEPDIVATANDTDTDMAILLNVMATEDKQVGENHAYEVSTAPMFTPNKLIGSLHLALTNFAASLHTQDSKTTGGRSFAGADADDMKASEDRSVRIRQNYSKSWEEAIEYSLDEWSPQKSAEDETIEELDTKSETREGAPAALNNENLGGASTVTKDSNEVAELQAFQESTKEESAEPTTSSDEGAKKLTRGQKYRKLRKNVLRLGSRKNRKTVSQLESIAE